MKYANTISYHPNLVTSFLSDENYYIIVGKCLSGSRHYSEALNWNEVGEEFDKYIAVVDYFGGGIVEVYTKEGDVCRSQVVMNFDF